MSIEEEEDGDGHLRKRCKTSSSHQFYNQNRSSRSIHFTVPPAQYNPLDEPSPLGLKLRKSPSLLDLIQMKLSETNACGSSKVEKKDVKASAASCSIDKLKASNFLASSLQIGCWKYVSRHEGDLVAKCYYSKHKLVWEILECGLKSKIEIRWSDIVDLKANCPDDKPGSLNLVLSRPPMFFKESNPQPKKHTVWEATTDFTNGHASMHRQHFLQFPRGVLKEHYERLIHCDMRLKCLSQQSEILMHTPYFVSQSCGSEGDISRNQVANQFNTAKVFPISNVQSAVLPLSSSLEVEQMGTSGIAFPHQSKEASSPSSGATEANGLCRGHNFVGMKNQEQSKVLHQSMSVSDLGNHISEQMTCGEKSECKDMLDNISSLLLNDTYTITVFDEKSLMSKINSLNCLLQDPVVDSRDQPDRETSTNGHTGFEPKSMCNSTLANMFKIHTTGHEKDVALVKEQSNMPRRDSFGDLLLHLHGTGSFPNLILNSEDDDYHT